MNSTVWIRGVAVVVGIGVLYVFALLAAGGLVPAVPHPQRPDRGRKCDPDRGPRGVPVWMMIVQGACGLLIVAIVVLVGQSRVLALLTGRRAWSGS